MSADALAPTPPRVAAIHAERVLDAVTARGVPKVSVGSTVRTSAATAVARCTAGRAIIGSAVAGAVPPGGAISTASTVRVAGGVCTMA